MNKPLLAIAGLIAAGGTATGVIYVASPGGEEEVGVQAQQTATATPTAAASASPGPSPTPSLETKASPSPTPATPPRTPGPGETLWRWGKVTLLVARDSGVTITRSPSVSPEEAPPDGGLGLYVRRGSSEAFIDADTGQISRQFVGGEDQPFIDRVLATISVGSRVGDDPSSWPLGAVSPSSSKVEHFGFRYWEPDPSSGIAAFPGCGAGSGNEGCWLLLYNGRSAVRAQIKMDKILFSDEGVAPEDAAAYERWTQGVELAGS